MNSTQNTRNFTVLTNNGNAPSYHEFIVHAEGCADLEKGPNRRIERWGSPIKGTTVEEAIKTEGMDEELEEMGFTEHDFHIMPCCH